MQMLFSFMRSFPFINCWSQCLCYWFPVKKGCGELLFWSSLFGALYASCILHLFLQFGEIFFYDFVRHIFWVFDLCFFSFLYISIICRFGLFVASIDFLDTLCPDSFRFNIFFDKAICISYTLSSGPEINSSMSFNLLLRLTSEDLFDILRFLFPVLIQFGFSLVIAFLC